VSYILVQFRNIRIDTVMRLRIHILSVLLALSLSLASLAQTALPEAPSQTQSHNIVRDIAVDQKTIWTAPAHVHKSDLKWILPMGAATAALIATDRNSSGALGPSATRQDISNGISYLGASYSTFGASGIMWAVGRWNHKERLQRTGYESVEALTDSSIVVLALKAATNRQRPLSDDHDGAFWEGGKSFPSGHAIMSWTMASVVAHEYHSRWIEAAAYGTASAVSVARFTGKDHFASDVLVGSTLGYLVGRFVVHRHKEDTVQGP
jgi:PAP2 superfamily protein